MRPKAVENVTSELEETKLTQTTESTQKQQIFFCKTVKK